MNPEKSSSTEFPRLQERLERIKFLLEFEQNFAYTMVEQKRIYLSEIILLELRDHENLETNVSTGDDSFFMDTKLEELDKYESMIEEEK